MSKTERALHEPGFDDAPGDVTDIEPEIDDGDGPAPVERASNGDFPAPMVAGAGFAPPTRSEDAGSSANGDAEDGHGEYPPADEEVDEPVDEPVEEGALTDAPADDGVDESALDESALDDPGAVALFDDDEFDDDEELDEEPEGLPAPVQGADGQVWTEPGADHVVVDEEPEEPALRDADELDAGPSADGTAAPVGIPGEALTVLPPGVDVLEELRQAKVDGPTVEVAPQDDDTGLNVRRPQRLRDYDPAPIPIPAKVPRLLGRKPRVRKVTRVVRGVDPWSVFKIAIIANLVLYVIVLTSGVLLWNVANATGTIDNVERFFESFGWTSFDFNGGEIYHSAWIAGLFLVVGLTGAAVLLATLFNLITDLVGGVRFTVLEEEVVERRTSPMRRFVVRRPEPEVPAVDRDDSGTIIREAVVDDSGAIVRRIR